ncbi:serine/threonine protein kinase [Thermostichus vulcanus]|uniref:non-specific serine/threonine protein kinase n=1 Tax=Thermostichus vulcanus str. 'Rupite' TaxID=2813851 RepID=A0ABT0CEQ8_THEVL|nr:serine/threonine-protein kinase [Thermostichus vulcanus]MCJ2544266.1 serine/threonine protein kinase [Thermostichus vulcanus str. 'Rupite']
MGSSISVASLNWVAENFSCGGFGCTYLVRDQHRPGKPLCVLKQLNPITVSGEAGSPLSAWQELETLSAALLGFQQEAEMLERVGSHPHLPQLLAYFEQDQHHYLVQQFLPGSPLDARPGVRWTAQQAIPFLRQMLAILSHLHQEGIIHRDIKPANILQVGDPEHATYNLVDFGAAVWFGEQPTYSLFIGTEGYAAPEQYEGHPRPNSDLYALGQVTLELLTGQAPSHSGQSSCQVYPLPPALWRLLKKMTEADPNQRYASCEAVLQDLDLIEAEHDPGDEETISKSSAKLGSSPRLHCLTS